MCQRGGVHFGSEQGVSRIALHCFFLLSLARNSELAALFLSSPSGTSVFPAWYASFEMNQAG